MAARKSPPDHEVVAAYLASNLSLAEYAELLGVTRQVISKILKRNGVAVKPVNPSRPRELVGRLTRAEPQPDGYWWDTREWLHAEFEEKSRSVRSIAAEVGASAETVTNRLRRHGFTIRKAWESTAAVDPATRKAQLARARQVAWQQSGDKIRASLRARSGSEPYQQADWLRTQHATRTVAEIAARCGVSVPTVY